MRCCCGDLTLSVSIRLFAVTVVPPMTTVVVVHRRLPVNCAFLPFLGFVSEGNCERVFEQFGDLQLHTLMCVVEVLFCVLRFIIAMVFCVNMRLRLECVLHPTVIRVSSPKASKTVGVGVGVGWAAVAKQRWLDHTGLALVMGCSAGVGIEPGVGRGGNVTWLTLIGLVDVIV
ncbi:hypothetical protein HanIR_Chr16g0797411 [Helianthus annuus]|nr:hypothetical protein HanIR_Chr16g0797411 [Helianthus annuus]